VTDALLASERPTALADSAGARAPLYRPPAPVPRPPVAALLRVMMARERDLLSLLPDQAYRMRMGALGASRRGILLVNAPELVTHVLNDVDELFPKSDLFTGALEGLVGNSIFVSHGETWRRQRRMVDPAFSHMRINRAFVSMTAAVDEYEAHLDAYAAEGTTFSLSAAMTHLTADVITRTIFSRSLAFKKSRDTFESFALFERSVANTDLKQLLLGKPFAHVPQPPNVRAACQTIRALIGEMLDPRMAPGAPVEDDIVGACIEARDPDTGARFTREELIDQIGVFFLAGHETTASALTWAGFILSQQPHIVARMRAEVDAVAGDGPISLEHVKRLTLTRNVFRETLRLYPPISFIPRVALADTRIGERKVRRGTMIMISPWTIHRHERLWRDADRFDPDRFTPEREREVPNGAYIPFGFGPRICVGAAFSTIESTLILARLVRRFDLEALAPETVRPFARLTARPAEEVQLRVRRRAGVAR
jgi:cytochrome P450